MELSQLVLFLAEALIIVGSLMVAFSPNILYAAFALMGSFFGVAILYVSAGSDFLGGAQIIVYVGGILVVILFAIMLSHRIYNIPVSIQVKRAIVGLLAGSGIFAILFNVNDHFPWKDHVKAELPAMTSQVTPLGNALLNEFVFPFEAISLLLLVALVGGMVMSRPMDREKRKDA